MSIKIGSLDHPVSSLSGGNQQKVVIAKWLPANPKVVLLDDPTKGVDVGAKAEIYSIVRALTEQGVAVLFNSSDDIELEELADRVLVMYEGNIVDELVGEQITHSALVAAALRVDEDPEEMPA
jgi:ABC-type sugar transport system ATPase subunit